MYAVMQIFNLSNNSQRLNDDNQRLKLTRYYLDTLDDKIR